MKTSVIGFPRVGTLRELKFASEKYFRKETGAEELLKEARRLRKTSCKGNKSARAGIRKKYKRSGCRC